MNFEIINDLFCLKGRSQEELAEWYCILNRWEWPKEIPDPEPVPKPVMSGETPRRDALFDAICSIVPHKLRSYTWNKDRMTKEDHEKWFKETFRGDQ